MVRISAAIAILASTFVCAAGECATNVPDKMQHVVVVFTQPKLDPKSFGAQPKDYMRAGTQFGRITEAEDPAMHIHQLLIVNAPDCWVCELDSKKAKHVITPVNEKVHFPIFPGRGPRNPLANKLAYLEFGNELEFFQKENAAKTEIKDAKGRTLDQYMLHLTPTLTLSLSVDPKTGKPAAINMNHKTQDLTLEYITYETLPFQASIFKPPSGLTIIEMGKAIPTTGNAGKQSIPGKPDDQTKQPTAPPAKPDDKSKPAAPPAPAKPK